MHMIGLLASLGSLYLPDAGGTLSKVTTTENISRHCQVSFREAKLVEKHWPFCWFQLQVPFGPELTEFVQTSQQEGVERKLLNDDHSHQKCIEDFWLPFKEDRQFQQMIR